MTERTARTAVLNFAGCIMDEMPEVTPFQPGNYRYARGMSTEGILRLLDGEAIRLHPDDLGKIRKQYPALPEWTGQWEPVDPTTVKAILWSPLVDSTFLYPVARCHDKTTYPIHDGFINGVCGAGHAAMSFEAMLAIWQLLDRTTARDGVQFRAIIEYPTDRLTKDEWKERIDNAQDAAVKTLGWPVFRCDSEPGPDNYWAHNSRAARERLWAAVRQAMMGATQGAT